MQLKWKKFKDVNAGQDDKPVYFKASSPIGTFYVMGYGPKWGASLNSFNDMNSDIDIGKLRQSFEAAQRDAQRFLNKVAAALSEEPYP